MRGRDFKKKGLRETMTFDEVVRLVNILSEVVGECGYSEHNEAYKEMLLLLEVLEMYEGN